MCRGRRKASTQLLGMKGTLAWARPSAVGALVMSSKTAVPINLRLPASRERHPCTSSGTQSARSRGRLVSGSPGDSGLPCGANHDRPLIVVVLSHHWEGLDGTVQSTHSILWVAPRISLKACTRMDLPAQARRLRAPWTGRPCSPMAEGLVSLRDQVVLIRPSG